MVVQCSKLFEAFWAVLSLRVRLHIRVLGLPFMVSNSLQGVSYQSFKGLQVQRPNKEVLAVGQKQFRLG